MMKKAVTSYVNAPSASLFSIFHMWKNLPNNIFGFMKRSSIKDMLIFFEFNPILLSIEYISFAKFVT